MLGRVKDVVNDDFFRVNFVVDFKWKPADMSTSKRIKHHSICRWIPLDARDTRVNAAQEIFSKAGSALFVPFKRFGYVIISVRRKQNGFNHLVGALSP